MVHNESVFLPIWLGYYSRFFAPQDIYVLDNDSTDGSTEERGFTRIRAEHDRVDHAWMVRRVESLQRELLERYDLVLVSDVDELIAPNPSRGTLGDYLDSFSEDYVNCLGYELLHIRDAERPFAGDRPILSQRGYWFPNGAYDKPAIASQPISYREGFHSRTDGQFNWDPDLRLVHLHRMDYAICIERHRVRSRRRWADDDLSWSLARHNRIVEEAEFERWFYSESGFENHGIGIELETVPASWGAVF
ncbi:MAG: glycosyltransferase family 2 protein [Solirubrobacterales bacterium]